MKYINPSHVQEQIIPCIVIKMRKLTLRSRKGTENKKQEKKSTWMFKNSPLYTFSVVFVIRLKEVNIRILATIEHGELLLHYLVAYHTINHLQTWSRDYINLSTNLGINKQINKQIYATKINRAFMTSQLYIMNHLPFRLQSVGGSYWYCPYKILTQIQ